MRRLLLATAVLLTACGSNEKSTTIDGTTYASDDSKGTATITTENGSVHTTSGDATAKVDMPDYAPRYPGSTIESTIEAENNGEKTRMVSASSSDPIPKVVEFYKASLTKAGWSVPSSMVSGESALLAGKNGEQQVSIVISREDEKTNILITIPNS